MMGLTERFEPDESSRHLTQVENFLLGKEKDVDDIVEHYGDDIDGPRLKLHRDMLQDRVSAENQVLEDFESIVIYSSKEVAFGGIIT